MRTCDRCFEYDRVREGTVQDMTGEVLCADCRDTVAEQAHEHWLSDYYGGSQPCTLQEQYDAAVRQKREGRR